MSTIAEALNLALQHHRAGDLAQAEKLYHQVLRADPRSADALHLLGMVAHQQGRHEQALNYLQQALALSPVEASFHNNLGLVYQALRQLEEASACYQQALRLRPDFPEALNNLATALQQQGRADDAVAAFLQALALRPDYSRAHYNLGNLLRDRGRLDEAAACYQQALYLQPGHPESHNNLGAVLLEQQRLAEAVACFRQALHLRPAYPEALNNLGNALREQGQLDEACACFRQALSRRPDNSEAHYNLANTLRDQGRLDEAVASYHQALALQPDSPDAHWNLGLTWLLQGHFDKGWPEYEWRWRTKDTARRAFGQPLWDGQPLAGRTILLYAEQGLGDTLHFVRFASLVQQRGGRVLLECQPPLRRMLAFCPGIDLLAVHGEPLPPFDFQAPLLSLPGILGTTLAQIPAAIPYLEVDSTEEERWGQELRGGGFKIGIAWQGRTTHKRDRHRSVPLGQFAALARVEQVCLFSLQHGPGSEQLAQADFPVTDLGSRFEDFTDLAAVMKRLDLVVTVDTAVAHCAGALGVPVWVALPFIPDWRWLMEREDSPWYPTIRLFRQKQAGQWAEVFARLVAGIQKLVAGRNLFPLS